MGERWESKVKTQTDDACFAGNPTENGTARYDPRRGCALDSNTWQRIGACLGLTQREKEVVRLFFEGHREPDLGPMLGISPHTAHTHLGRIYRKLGVKGLPELLLRVFSTYLALGGSGKTHGTATKSS